MFNLQESNAEVKAPRMSAFCPPACANSVNRRSMTQQQAEGKSCKWHSGNEAIKDQRAWLIRMVKEVRSSAGDTQQSTAGYGLEGFNSSGAMKGTSFANESQAAAGPGV